MSQMQMPAMSFAGLDNYEPYEGGAGHGVPAREGIYRAKILSGKPEMTDDGTKARVVLGTMLLDEDAPAGLGQIDRPFYFGQDRNGNSMARQLADVMCSVGTSKEDIQARAHQGTNVAIEDICASLVNREGYVEIVFEVQPVGKGAGEIRSVIKNWVTPERYEKLKEAAGGQPPRGATVADFTARNKGTIEKILAKLQRAQGMGAGQQAAGTSPLPVGGGMGGVPASPGIPAGMPAPVGVPAAAQQPMQQQQQQFAQPQQPMQQQQQQQQFAQPPQASANIPGQTGVPGLPTGL